MKNLLNKQEYKMLLANPKAYMSSLGYNFDEETKVVVKQNTKNTTYVVLNQGVNTDDLGAINAAGACAGTIGSASSAACAGSVTSTASSGSSLGTIGTAASQGKF
ncbi:hypothetical protein SPONN_2808 [uncultured Candidatus Thioglobus sp.]|nr:hypothetical protein SPONN_2808 [uncultured Candidatus Thioglobus sp.]SMM99478.1 hypothetical protein SPONL_612 [uncultured Candidatus Thioglobus sp.]